MDKNKAYSRKKLVLGLGEQAWEMFLILIILVSGLTFWFEKFSILLGPGTWRPVRVFLYLIPFTVFMEVITLPLSFYSGYVVEHQFHLSHQKQGQWYKQHFKAVGLGFLLTGMLFSGFYEVIERFPQSWWWISSILLMIVLLLLTLIFPLVIIPLFYKMTPLEEGALTNRLTKMAQKVGVSISQVMRLDLSKDTAKANAAVTGLGKKKKIVLADNLLDNFTEDEIAVVFAHELGHHRHKHIIKLFTLETAVIWIGFLLAYKILPSILESLGIESLVRLSTLPLFLLAASLYGFILKPLKNAVSRKYEFEADRCAVTLTGLKEAFVSAMNRLKDMNLANPEPHPWVENLLYSHPSIKNRIQAVEKS